MQRLLILSCSNRKIHSGCPTLAWDVYDGGAFRSLKKVRREGKWPSDLDILILSAKYGLIDQYELITCYDQKMTTCHPVNMRTKVRERLRAEFERHKWEIIALSMGKNYLLALADVKWPPGVRVGVVPGAMGIKISLTKQWVISPDEAVKSLQWIW
jgi:hypothetical protein